MPPKKRKTTAQSTPPTFSQSVPLTLQVPYTGPDRLTPLADELKLRICSYLHKTGEECWSDKSDLKAVRLVARDLSVIAKEELFRYMRLGFTHQAVGIRDYEEAEVRAVWITPKLLDMVEAEPKLLTVIRAVRIQIVPVPIPMPMSNYTRKHEGFRHYEPELMRHYQISNLLRRNDYEVANRIQLLPSLPDVPETFSYIDDGNDYNMSVRTLDETFADEPPIPHPDDLYYHLFGRPSRRWPWEEPQRIQPFAEFVLDCMRRRFLPHFMSLKHLEAGAWQGPRPEGWSFTEFEKIKHWSLAFANALVLKTSCYARINSLRLVGVPARGEGVKLEWAIFSIRQVAYRFIYFGDHLTSLDLDVEQLRDKLDDDDYGAYWSFHERMRRPNGLKFWTEMLQHLQNLKDLNLTNSSYRFEHRDTPRLCFDELLTNLSIPRLKVLSLTGWAVRSNTLVENLYNSFPALAVLDLDSIDLHSDDENAWDFVLRSLVRKFAPIEIGQLRNLRRRPLAGADKGYVKTLLKAHTQVGMNEMWNRAVKAEENVWSMQ